jgi:HAMP domain-containing protein
VLDAARSGKILIRSAAMRSAVRLIWVWPARRIRPIARLRNRDMPWAAAPR